MQNIVMLWKPSEEWFHLQTADVLGDGMNMDSAKNNGPNQMVLGSNFLHIHVILKLPIVAYKGANKANNKLGGTVEVGIT